MSRTVKYTVSNPYVKPVTSKSIATPAGTSRNMNLSRAGVQTLTQKGYDVEKWVTPSNNAVGVWALAD
jgi:hypothetical protein